MSEVVVDTEKLAYGLKKGIANGRTIFASAEYSLMLRYSACGLVSSAINQYCQSQEIASELRIIGPQLPFDPDMQHVVPVITESPADPTIVDGAYSQFLRYAACRHQLESMPGYPAEEVIAFRFSERDIFLDWITNTAIRYDGPQHQTYDDDAFSCHRPLASLPASAVRDAYASIWDTANLTTWTPPDYVINDGRLAAQSIPADAVQLV